MNKKSFYDSIRKSLFGGSLTSSQVSGIEAKLTAFKAECITDMRMVAYMLATSYHETGKTMQPVREFGHGKGKDYGKMLKMGKGPGKRVPYKSPLHIYYGRGDVQLTWWENYYYMGKILGIPLLQNPDLALDPVISAKILIEGMTKGKSSFGDFTGKCLEDYFTSSKTDWLNARRIVNGMDCAEDIAGYAKKFYTAIIVF